ncbi:hypothetical protein [Natrinema pallidum]|uniref:hypothetical protein n=1 Tax=Natrinema pallidum TaxID=69527 RepID=UPI003753B049
MSEVCPACGEDPEKGYRCQNCGKDLVGSETEAEQDDLMADGGHDYHVRVSAPNNPEHFAKLIDSLGIEDKVVWNGRSEPFTVTQIPVNGTLNGIGRFEKRLVLENQTRENGAEFRLWFKEGTEGSPPFTTAVPARCMVQRQIGEDGNNDGWGRTTDVESLAHVNPVEAAGCDGDREVATDGGQLETTDEVVLEQIDALQDEGKHGAPIGTVIEAVLEETEVSFGAIFETTNWLHANGEIYCPARGYLRQTPGPDDDDENGGGET